MSILIANLTDIAVRYPAYHLSYPKEHLTLVKNEANVAVDLCCITSLARRRALYEFLETVPANKVHEFGGDSIFVEDSYGHAIMAKENIARVLAERMMNGDMTAERAAAVGRWLLRENAIEWFNLWGKVPAKVLGS